MPGSEDGVDPAPRGFDFVATHEQGRVAAHHVQQQTLVGIRLGYAKGVGDLNELARSADIAMPAIPDSGSMPRLAAMAAAGNVGAIGANLLGQGGLKQAAIGAASLAAPYLAGKAMLSPPGRALLSGKGTSIPSIIARGAGSFLVP